MSKVYFGGCTVSSTLCTVTITHYLQELMQIAHNFLLFVVMETGLLSFPQYSCMYMYMYSGAPYHGNGLIVISTVQLHVQWSALPLFMWFRSLLPLFPAENKMTIVRVGALQPLIYLLATESTEVQCNACGCITTLATTGGSPWWQSCDSHVTAINGGGKIM